VALTKFNYNSFDLTTAASKGLAFNSSANGFETSSSTSMVLIKTLTASSSANLQFVHGSSDVVLDSTYPVYLFKLINIHGANSQEVNTDFSVDSGSNYSQAKTSTFFEAKHSEDDGTTSIAYDTARDLAQSNSGVSLTTNVGNGNDESACAEMYLFNPSSTTFVKHFITRSVYYDENGAGVRNSFGAGYRNTTSAVNAVKFQMDSGNMDSGTIKLYGIKDS